MAEGDAPHADSAPDDPEPETGEDTQQSEDTGADEDKEPTAQQEKPRRPGRRPRPGRLLRRVSTALVILVLALAAASYAFDLGPRTGLAGPSPISQPEKVPPPEGLTLPKTSTVGQVAQRTEPSAADPQAVRRVLRPLVRGKRLGRLAVDVDQLGDGNPLYGHGPRLVTPASTMKLLTTTAALQALGPGHRFTTSAVTGTGSREVVLVGGGDPLLEAAPPKDPSQVYPARADLQTLAAATARSLRDIGRTTVRLRYDASLFSGRAVNPHWPAGYIGDNVVSPITALWVNEGRLRGTSEQAPRSAHPASYAARQFAADLAQHGIKVLGHPRPGVAPGKTTTLGSVQSAPLAEIVQHILEVSDNEGAEVLARQVAVAEGVRASFAGATRAVRSVLAGIGVDTSADTILDGSGLSRQDRLTPDTLLSVLHTDAQPGHAQLRAVLTSLPVAGFTGTLAYRFTQAPKAGLGEVRAKTGTLTGVSGLAGVVTTRDGSVLSFVAVANGYKPAATLVVRDRLDQIAASLARCACAMPPPTASSTP